MIENFYLNFNALQKFVATKNISKPYKRKNLEKPMLLKTIKSSLKKTVSGDFKDFTDNSKVTKLVFNEFRKQKNRNQNRALELLSFVEGNY